MESFGFNFFQPRSKSLQGRFPGVADGYGDAIFAGKFFDFGQTFLDSLNVVLMIQEDISGGKGNPDFPGGFSGDGAAGGYRIKKK